MWCQSTNTMCVPILREKKLCLLSVKIDGEPQIIYIFFLLRLMTCEKLELPLVELK